MKLFAIVTAGLMAVGGGVYFYSTSACSKSGCNLSAPVATTGGCCSKSTSVTSDCSAAQEDCCVIAEACCSIAAGAETKVAACCAAAKQIEIKGCCDEACDTARTVTAAATSIAGAK